MSRWAQDAIFYHIFPLGFCGAPARNDFQSKPEPRLKQIETWIDHLLDLGINAIYLGPVFESTSHGYDTADYFKVDRRLGDWNTLKSLVNILHQNGIRVILDGVFNHVGRNYWAFQDVLQLGRESRFCDWFSGLDFNQLSPYDDPFSYHSWNGHYSLVKLNLQNQVVVSHLLEAVSRWILDLNIDGLRLDAADCIDLSFQKQLSTFSRNLKPDFWLVGEIIHGDYRHWANPETLDSVTNYESYKGLYSSLNDHNYYEIAYALNRQFGESGLYRTLPLYNFVDNHDVDRVGSILRNPAHLYPLYGLLMTMPGVPSIYYGSEWGIKGKKENDSDAALRPCLNLQQAMKNPC